MQKNKVAIAFPTYQREQMATSLINEINRQSTVHEYDIYSFIDGSDYYLENSICEKLPHHGKKSYWKLYNRIIKKVKGKYDYYIYISDDSVLCENFIDVAIDKFKRSNATVLNLLTDNRVNSPNWTKTDPVINGEYIQTQWVDMAMIFGNDYIKEVGECPPINPSRFDNTNKSSGVGEWISKKLNQKGHKIFHVKETMIYHGQHTSVMNNESRVKCNLSNIPIIAGVATFKGREESLFITYTSIIKQVDELHIYVNDESKINKHIRNDKKVTIYRHPEGDLGDSGKFYFNQNRVAYFFTLDDDLIYPKDYVNCMVSKIEQHGRQCVITLHGKIINGLIRSYYKNNFINYRCLDDVYGDVNVDIPGTGVMAWFSNTIRFDISDFELKNMADIWAAIKCRKENVSVICAQHQKGWLNLVHNESTLWISNKSRDKVIVKALKSIDWKL